MYRCGMSGFSGKGSGVGIGTGVSNGIGTGVANGIGTGVSNGVGGGVSGFGKNICGVEEISGAAVASTSAVGTGSAFLGVGIGGSLILATREQAVRMHSMAVSRSAHSILFRISVFLFIA